MSKIKGEYHYAIQALESRLAKIKKKPSKFKHADDRIASLTSALETLRENNFPLKQKAVRLHEPTPTEEVAKSLGIDNPYS